jgi:predicted Ser/Thr protein kinase
VTKADIFLWEAGGERLAIKDYASRPSWIRMTLGRSSIRHEVSAYERLRNIPGIPRFAGQIDRLAFAVDFVEGRDLSHFRPGEVAEEFFAKLARLLDSVHDAGVAQGDLHHRDVLVGPEGTPYLVDFSTAIILKESSGPWKRRLFLAACGSDRRAALKLKRRHVPRSMTEAELHELNHPPAWYVVGKRLGRLLRPRRRR